MHFASVAGFIFGLLCFFVQHQPISCEDCSQKTIASSKWRALGQADLIITLNALHVVHTISISGPMDAFFLNYTTNDEDDWRQYLDENGLPQIFRSYTQAEATSNDNGIVPMRVGFLAKRLQIVSARVRLEEGEMRVDVTGCRHSNNVHQYDGIGYSSVDPSSSGMIALYYNDLYINFRTTVNGVLFASQAGQGDLLLLQIRQGVAQAYFDFGSRATSLVSGGSALNDGKWHELRWSHQFNTVNLYVDGVRVDQIQLTNAYRKLDFDAKIYIGGLVQPQFPMSSLAVRANMTGCIRLLRFNQVDVLAAADHHQVTTAPSCKVTEQGEITFVSGDSSVTYSRSNANTLSVQFRTFAPIANVISLLDEKNTVVAQINVKDGQLVLLVSSLDMPPRLQETGSEGAFVADGAWHLLSFSISEESLSVELDGERSAWMDGTALSAVRSKTEWFRLGGGGLIGCMRMLQRDKEKVPLRSHAKRTDVVIFNACGLISRCDRNPCENGGNCTQVGLDAHKCQCTPNYSGPTCHTAIAPHSCEEHFITSRDSVSHVMIDLDGGGPLSAIRVQCSRTTSPKGEGGESPAVATQLNHDTPTIHVRGFADAGGFYRRLDYAGVGAGEMDELVTGFDHCAQEMIYECRGGATLMSHAGSPNRPSSWYVGRNGHHGLQWGDAQLQSRMCSCAGTATCVGGGVCNCDSGEDAVDAGNNTHLSILPVTELFIGGTDSRNKNVSVTIGPLRCVDRVAFQPVTFLSRDAALSGELDEKETFDVSLHVRTTQSDGTLMHAESLDGDEWATIYFKDERVYGQTVAAGRLSQVYLNVPTISDDQWHVIYFEIGRHGLSLSVDGRPVVQYNFTIPPLLRRWRIGSPTQSAAEGGFAGMLRSVYVSGKEVRLTRLVEATRLAPNSIVVGERGRCSDSPCLNGGLCMEKYDSFACNCSETAFKGPFCTDDVGVSFTNGAQLRYALHHGLSGNVFRIGFQSSVAPTPLLRATGLFTDAALNLSLTADGFLELAVFDGKGPRVTAVDSIRRFDDDEFYDVTFSFLDKLLTLKINGYQPVHLTAETWAYLTDLDVWMIAGESFAGCVSRLQIGRAFPLKLSLSSPRLTLLQPVNATAGTATIQNRACPSVPYTSWLDYGQGKQEQMPSLDTPLSYSDSTISVRPVVEKKRAAFIYGPLIALCFLSAVLALALAYCYVRSKPDGVYKTNEDVMRFATPSRSDEPLVLHAQDKEYFC